MPLGAGEGGRSGMSIIASIDCSTSNGIPERVMCCYAKMGKFASKTEGAQIGVPVVDRPPSLVQYQYGLGLLLVLAFKNGARTSIGI